MMPTILKALLNEIDPDLQKLIPDTNDGEFQDASVQVLMVQMLRNTKAIAVATDYLMNKAAHQ